VPVEVAAGAVVVLSGPRVGVSGRLDLRACQRPPWAPMRGNDAPRAVVPPIPSACGRVAARPRGRRCGACVGLLSARFEKIHPRTVVSSQARRLVGLSPKDRKTLWGRSRHLCAFPQCRRQLTEDQVDATTGETFQTVVGEEAHIYSPSPDGPRYDAKFPTSKLETYENRILLCSIHHTLIDSEKGRAYDPETLLAMKRRHEWQEERRERISGTVRAYVADQYEADDRVLFRQVKLEGPRVDAMFVDVPFASRGDTETTQRLAQIAADAPGDAIPDGGFVVTGAAQALLHPDWAGNALIVGGPGQGKSTLLQFVCQFHRARFQYAVDYTGGAQGLKSVTDVVRVPIRLDLRDYAQWASSKAVAAKAKAAGPKRRRKPPERRRPFDDGWPPLERFLADQIGKHSGGRNFKVDDLSTLLATEPVLLAFDGLDEVANLEHRDRVANEIVRACARLQSDAHNLVVVVASRPGMTTSPLWSSPAFPVFYLQKLTAGLRLQYLQRWSRVADLSEELADKLQRTFLEHENLPHIRDLGPTQCNSRSCSTCSIAEDCFRSSGPSSTRSTFRRSLIASRPRRRNRCCRRIATSSRTSTPSSAGTCNSRRKAPMGPARFREPN
jgi:hypothetical protein